MPREPREVHHVDDFRRLAAENDSSDVASSRSDDAGDVACDAFTTTSDVEAGGVRVRTVDHNARRETDYVIVVHGTFDAPPADGARTWYQPPAPGEQNFCAKMGALLARGPIGAESVWRAIPRATDSQGAESQGAESQGSEVFRSGSQTGQSQGGAASQKGQSQGGAASQKGQSQGGAASQKGQSQGGAASQEGGQSWQRMMDGDVPYPFFWDGSNTHEGRVKAAEKVRQGGGRAGRMGSRGRENGGAGRDRRKAERERGEAGRRQGRESVVARSPVLFPVFFNTACSSVQLLSTNPRHCPLLFTLLFASPLRPICFPSPPHLLPLSAPFASPLRPICFPSPPHFLPLSAPFSSPLRSNRLARLLDLIARRDPSARIHVIAHSHGGNVLLKAIELVSAVQSPEVS
ncbi:unnamed protein product [Closterium sp. NIES-64]|nr:unnamed protein product [Closterium sp. NIES-64]